MRIRVAVTTGLTVLLVLGAVGPAQAAITVAIQNDSGPGSLRQAVADALPAETIVLPAGTYTLASTLMVEKTLTIAGHGAGDTTIRAAGAFRVIDVPKRTELEMSGVTIRDGRASGTGAYGGGVFAMFGNVILRRDVITGNIADATTPGIAAGGGVAVTNGLLELIESSVTGNTARADGATGAAAGTAIGGGIYSDGPVDIVDSTIAGNTAEAIGGQGPSNPSQDGGSGEAGGLYIGTVTTGAEKITGSTISGNATDASPGPGGEGGTSAGGGFIANSVANPTTVLNTTIASNTARISGSTGTVAAGGAYPGAIEHGLFLMLGATIAGNRVEGGENLSGGNVYFSTYVNVRDSLVANGSGPAGSEDCGGATAESLGFNLDSINQCSFNTVGDKVNSDPLLGPLQDNGGPTQTMLPAASSPAIDAGVAARPFDQRGVVRPIDFPSIANAPGGDGSDIGAVELQPFGAINLGKLTKNKKKGTARLIVTLPAPSAGTLTLSGGGLKTQTVAVTGQTSLTMTVATKGGAAKSLRKKGSKKVKFEVTYAPTGNSPVAKSSSTKLVRKAKKKH